METAYKEIMAHVTVTEDMRQRVLENIQAQEPSAKKGRRGSISLGALAAAACLALVVAGTIALPRMQAPHKDGPPPGVQQALPGFVEAASLRELEEAVGFAVEELHDLPFTPEAVGYLAYRGGLAEVKYRGEGQTLSFRKAQGSEDISGDFTQYASTAELELDGTAVTLKGGDGAYSLALWQKDGFSYALRAELPLQEAEWTDLLASLQE